MLEAHVPRPALAEAARTGRRFSGSEALARGIVTGLAPAETLLEQAAAQAGKDRQVIAAHKRLLHGDVTST